MGGQVDQSAVRERGLQQRSPAWEQEEACRAPEMLEEGAPGADRDAHLVPQVAEAVEHTVEGEVAKRLISAISFAKLSSP